MSYRFTNTDKWNDAWFSGLSQIQMLLFLYLCDNCDIAGFIEINYKKWASDLNSSPETIEGACKGLGRGLIFSESNDCIYIKNFLKHQKNYPLNERNKSHLGIIKRFSLYSYKFGIDDIYKFIEGASKGLTSPTGNGIGNNIDSSSKKEQKFYFSEFYDNQLSVATDERYAQFVKYLFGENKLKAKLSGVLSIREQLTEEQFLKVMDACQANKRKLGDILTMMENDKKYYKDKKSLYRTLLNWAELRFVKHQ